VDLFLPLLSSVKDTGWIPLVFSGDKYYAGIHGGVESRCAEFECPVEVVKLPITRPCSNVYVIDLIRAIVLVGIGCQSRLRQLLKQNDISVLVLGNDTGHLERAIIHAAKSENIKTILIQDGFLLRTGHSKYRDIFIEYYSKYGGRWLGGIPYGIGGADYVLAAGVYWESELRYRCKRQNTTVINSYPSCLDTSVTACFPKSGSKLKLIFFTTNYLSAFRDEHAHNEQIGEILRLYNILAEDVDLVVKLHPADQFENYLELYDKYADLTVVRDVDLDLLIDSSWICVTHFSSVFLKVVGRGKVCLWVSSGMSNIKYTIFTCSLPGTHIIDESDWILLLRLRGREVYHHYWKIASDATNRLNYFPSGSGFKALLHSISN